MDPLGHTANDKVEENRIEAECEKEGSYDEVIYCAVCEKELVREHHTIEALEHQYEEKETHPASCIEDGYIEYECSVCGAVYDKPYAVCPHCNSQMGGSKYDPDWVDEMAGYDEIFGDD